MMLGLLTENSQIEQFAITAPEESWAEHEAMRECAEQFLQVHHLAVDEAVLSFFFFFFFGGGGGGSTN